MEIHGTHVGADRQEIRCADCGHHYFVSRSAKSGRCARCGNIQAVDLRGLGMSLVRDLLPRMAPRGESEAILSRFQAPPPGEAVQGILMRYQVEWQLWAMVVKNFSDPAYHGAYLSHSLSRRRLDLAAGRYREHRNVMALAKESGWQAEISDLMLERLEALAASMIHQESGGALLWPDWLMDLPTGKGVFRIGWLTLGMLLVFRVFGLV